MSCASTNNHHVLESLTSGCYHLERIVWRTTSPHLQSCQQLCIIPDPVILESTHQQSLPDPLLTIRSGEPVTTETLSTGHKTLSPMITVTIIAGADHTVELSVPDPHSPVPPAHIIAVNRVLGIIISSIIIIFSFFIFTIILVDNSN